MPQGFLHTKMDVKILLLFVLSRIGVPVDISVLYEICYQDESLNYFMLSECLTELVFSGHVNEDQNNKFVITEKGRNQGAIVEDSLAIPVVNKVSAAIEKKKNEFQRANSISADYAQSADGNWYASLTYTDGNAELLRVTLYASDEQTAAGMADNLLKNISDVYKCCMDAAIDANRKSIRETK